MPEPPVLQVCVVPGVGGAEHHVLALSRALAGDRRLAVVAAEGGWLADAARRAGLEVAVVPDPRGNFDVRTLLALRRIIRRTDPSVVHSHLGRSDWYAWLALSGDRETRFVSTEHGISPDRDLYVRGSRRRLHETAHAARLRRCDAVVAVSNATAASLLDRYAVLRTKPPAVISPGIERTALFEVERRPRDAGAPLRVATVARLDVEKGPDLALRAFAALRSQGVEASLTFAGDGPERQRLERLAGELGVAADVAFAGRVEDVEDVLAQADVLLAMSRSENLPIAVLEGMASGVPVVSTDVGGVSEVVTAGVEGLLVAAGDVEGAAEALRALAADESRRLSMGERARERARAYDIGRTAKAIDRLYETLR